MRQQLSNKYSLCLNDLKQELASTFYLDTFFTLPHISFFLVLLTIQSEAKSTTCSKETDAHASWSGRGSFRFRYVNAAINPNLLPVALDGASIFARHMLWLYVTCAEGNLIASQQIIDVSLPQNKMNYTSHFNEIPTLFTQWSWKVANILGPLNLWCERLHGMSSTHCVIPIFQFKSTLPFLSPAFIDYKDWIIARSCRFYGTKTKLK